MRYTGFSSNVEPSSGVTFDDATAQFTIDWDIFSDAGTYYITTWITIENDDGLSVQKEFQIEYAICTHSCQDQPDIMYLINSGEQVFQFVNIFELNERCGMKLEYDEEISENISWISYDERSEFTMTCTDSNE